MDLLINKLSIMRSSKDSPSKYLLIVGQKNDQCIESDIFYFSIVQSQVFPINIAELAVFAV
jgi:hypothetical protein